MNIRDWVKKKIIGLIGISKESDAPDADRLVFINNDDKLTIQRIHEYNLWYQGDADELLNFYTHQNTIEYNYEPWYSRNKRNYFWAISSSESDIKRTHSGMFRDVIDTLVNIMPFPMTRAGVLDLENTKKKNVVDSNLQKIIKESGIKDIYTQKQLPMTLVEGWGCYKINWDLNISDYPILVYYRAENVDFVYQNDKITGIIFKDYYNNGKKRYMLSETRRIKSERDTAGRIKRNLVIEKELFEVNLQDPDYIKAVDFSAVPELQDVEKYIEIGPYNGFLAMPCIIFENTSKCGGYGRSIMTGKISLFDDLDQCLSQAANAVRKSTPIEYFNTDFLERDNNGMPKQPKAYDRKYTLYRGQRSADGSSTSDAPVTVTQPNVDFHKYSEQAVQIQLQIINGIMSPATLGIDISKKDNAEAQREKEKVTIFTRNAIIDKEMEILRSILNEMLCAYEFMHKGEITVQDYDISIKYNEFADDSFENKLKVLGQAFAQEDISEDMFMQKLYGDTLSPADYKKELDWLKEHHTAPRDEGMLGAAGGGMNVPGGPGADKMAEMLEGRLDEQ